MERIVGAEPSVFNHAMIIQTNEDTYTIEFDLLTLKIGDTEYYKEETVGNPLYMLVSREDLEWEIGP